MRLALKLSLAMMAGILIALAVDGFIEVNRQVEIYETDIQGDLALQGRTLAAAVAKLWQTYDEEGAVQVLRSANDSVAGTRARLLPADGLLQIPTSTHLRPEDLPALRAGASVVHLIDGPNLLHGAYAYTPVRVTGGALGILELSKPALPEDHFVRARLGSAVGTVAILALVTFVIAMGLGARLVGVPIAALIAKAQRAGRGDFSGPLGIVHRDEIGALAGAIDDMCDQLDTAQKRVARETAARLSAMNQLRRADRLTTVGRLAAGLAHELGTPLNVISERVKMLAYDELAADERPANLAIILAQLDRITTTIRQLLDFSRQHEPEKMPCDLSELARQTGELVKTIAEKHHVDIEVCAPNSPAVEDVDPRQIQQVLTNLMVNGIQSMQNGGKLVVSIDRERAKANEDAAEREYWSIAVVDNGRGIPQKVLPHIFEPFFTTKDIGEGTGLGLSVSLGIVEEHGGFIAVKSDIGVGSRFTVHLPVGGEV